MQMTLTPDLRSPALPAGRGASNPPLCAESEPGRTLFRGVDTRRLVEGNPRSAFGTMVCLDDAVARRRRFVLGHPSVGGVRALSGERRPPHRHLFGRHAASREPSQPSEHAGYLLIRPAPCALTA